jgi:hypothetical protein
MSARIFHVMNLKSDCALAGNHGRRGDGGGMCRGSSAVSESELSPMACAHHLGRTL